MNTNNSHDHIPSVNFNRSDDKDLGIFNSTLWSRTGMDAIRDGLMKYCMARREHIEELSPVVNAQRENYKKQRNSVIDNCFSYSAGFTTKGELPLSPYMLNKFDMRNSTSEQMKLFSLDEMSFMVKYFYSSPNNFLQNLSYINIPSFAQINENQYADFKPSIALVNESNFHWVSTDVYTLNNKPTVLFSQKRGRNPVSEDYTLEEFVDYYKLMCFANPSQTLVATPKNFIGCEVNANLIAGQALRVNLKPPQPALKNNP